MFVERFLGHKEKPKAVEEMLPAKNIIRAGLGAMAHDETKLLTKTDRLNKKGKWWSEQIFKQFGLSQNWEEVKTACNETREEIKEQEKLVRQGLIEGGVRRQLRREWKTRGRDWNDRIKKEDGRSNWDEYQEELEARISDNEAMKQIKEEKRVLASLYQKAAYKGQEKEAIRVKGEISDEEVERYRLAWEKSHEGKKMPKGLAKGALMSKVRAELRRLDGVDEESRLAIKAQIDELDIEDFRLRWERANEGQTMTRIVAEKMALNQATGEIKEWDKKLDSEGFGVKEVADFKEKYREERNGWRGISTYQAKKLMVERIGRLSKAKADRNSQIKPSVNTVISRILPAVTAGVMAASPILAAFVPVPAVDLNAGRRGNQVMAEGMPALRTTSMLKNPYDYPPEKIMELLLEGRVPIDEAIEAHMQLPKMVRFNKSNGETIGVFRQVAKTEPKEIPRTMGVWLDAVEGPIDQEGRDLLIRLGVRNAKALAGWGTFSGGSNEATQLAQLIGGYWGGQVLLNEEHPGGFHNPEKYSLSYLLELTKDIYSNDPLTAKDVQRTLITGASSLRGKSVPEGTVDKTVAMLCAKFESVLAGRKLIENYGQNGVLEAYIKCVPMGATREGLPVFGLEAKGMDLFGKSLSELNRGEMIALIGLIQAPSGYSKLEDIKDRARTLLEILGNKGLVDREAKEDIERQIDDLSYCERGEVANRWINDEELVHQRTRKEIFEYLAVILEGRIPQGAVVEGDTIVIRTEALPVPEVKGQMAMDRTVGVETTEAMSRPLDRQIEEKIGQAIKASGDNYTYTLEGGRVLKLPAFNNGGERFPGLAAVIYDPKEKAVVAAYDPSGIMTKVPVAPGSTIKSIMTAFLIHEGGYSLETKVSNIPGHYALLSKELVVSNAADTLNLNVPDNQLNLASALAYSTNVVFERLLGEYLGKHPDDGWNKLRAFFKEVGVTLTDTEGQELSGPTDYAAIGSDLCVSLEDLARAYAVIADPAASLKDPEMIKVFEGVKKTLADQSLKAARTPTGGVVWAGESLEYFNPKGKNGEEIILKTGTVSAGEYTFNLMTGGGITTKDGRSLGIAVVIFGQDGKGRVVNLAGNYGSSLPLPIARELLQYGAEQKIESVTIPTAEMTKEKLTAIWEGGITNNYAVATTNKQAWLMDKFGMPVMVLQPGEAVDVVGRVNKEWQAVAIERKGKIVTGLVKTADLGPSEIAKNAEIVSKIVTLDDSKSGKNWVVVSTETKSPLLQRIFQDLKTRGQLMAGVEDYGRLAETTGMNSETMFVNGEMIGMFTGESVDSNNLTWPQIALAEVIKHQSEHEKLNRILNESRTGVSVNELMWTKDGRPTASQRLIDIMTDYQIGAETEKGFREMAEYIKHGDNRRLIEVWNTYDVLMGRAGNNQSLTGKRAERLVRLMEDLNQNANQEEMTALGLATINFGK